EIHVVRYHQIKPPVAVIVHEGTSGAPVFSRARDAGFFSNFREGAMIVVVEAILPIVGDVQVFPTIVVVVADADALSPARGIQTGSFSHVCEGSVVVVVIQATGRPFSRGKSIEFGAIYQKDVGPAIVVVVENGDAVSRGLDDVFLGVDSAEDVLCSQPRLFGDVSE